jgi:PAS domain-containing protein
MPQKAVELILMRQLASYLAMPILMFDPDGTLLFYNEPAEVLSGRRFDETGEIPFEEWSSTVHATDDDGTPLPFEVRPLGIALLKRQAAHRKFWAQGADGIRRKFEATAFPLEGQGGRHLGAVMILWEAPS